MNTETYKIVKNTKISTRNGGAFMGSIVKSSDVVNPACLPGMLKSGAIELVEKGGKTELKEAPEATEAPKTTKKSKKSKDKKPKED